MHDDLITKIATLEAELLEQARVVGAGGERELALLAKVERLEAEVARLRKSLKVEVEVETAGTTARAALGEQP